MRPEQLNLIFEQPKPEPTLKEVKNKRSKRKVKMGYDPSVGKFSKTTETRAAQKLNTLNTGLKFVLHPASKGKTNYEQDLDIYQDEKLIGHIEVQTTKDVRFDKYADWQFYGRRLLKHYDPPHIHVQQDAAGELLVLTPKEYKAFFVRNHKEEMRYSRNSQPLGLEYVCKLPISDLTLFREKNSEEKRDSNILSLLRGSNG